jgi:hypothetical protein
MGAGRRLIIKFTDTAMSYMQNLEARLNILLAGVTPEEQAAIIREMKAVVLESYRNGQKAGAAPKTGKRATAKAAPAKT